MLGIHINPFECIIHSYPPPHTVRKEMKSSEDSEKLHELVRDTSRKLEKYETDPCSIMYQSVQ